MPVRSILSYGVYPQEQPQEGLLCCGIFAPIFICGTSKNSPFAIWPDLLLQLCIMKILKYTKYSGISMTGFETKSIAQIIKKEFLKDALWNST